MRNLTIFCILIAIAFSSSAIISEEEITNEELALRVKVFNDWYHNLNPTSVHLEARLTENGVVRLFTTKAIDENQNYLTITKDQMITHNFLHTTKYAEIMKEAEQNYGYDDLVNFALILISEKFNPESKWKPYLDLLPPKPSGLLFDFWNNKPWMESTFKNLGVLKFVLEHRVDIEKKGKAVIDALIKKNPDTFDENIFNLENIIWGLVTAESKIQFVNYESFLLPMFDFLTYGEYKYDKTKFFNPEKDAEGTIKIKAITSFNADSKIYDNPRLPNHKLLMSYGQVVNDYSIDCFPLSLSFSSKKDDDLQKKRSTYFSKYFIFDQNHFDVINECISIKSPFSRKMMFFFYVSMMDSTDLNQPDPKRVNLEQDRIIVEYAMNQLRTHLMSIPGSASDSMHLASLETDNNKKSGYIYKAEQIKLLASIIGVFEDEYNRLLKEDSL